MRKIIVAAMFAASLLGTGHASASPGVCQYLKIEVCQPQPPVYGGPILNKTNVPGTTGGWTTLPVQCDPITRTCQQVVP